MEQANITKKKPTQSTSNYPKTSVQQPKPLQNNPQKVTSLYVVNNPRDKYAQSCQKKLSRLLDNHVCPPHEDPWIALGLSPPEKYNYNDSGLGIQANDKFQDKLNETRQKITTLRQQQGVRDFPEFKDSTDKDCLVIIEYCSDCAGHESTTRHDQKQYEDKAKSLNRSILSHFPICKVTLKPVRIDPFASQLEGLAARQKVGTFDIFVKSSTNKSCIFSKLKKGRWPQETEILNQISSFMPTCTFQVQLSLKDFDLQRLPDELKTSSKFNKLLDIPVSLLPNRQKDNKPQSKNNPSDDAIIAKTDKNGHATFENIPIEAYSIQIKETNDYKTLREKVDLFQLKKQKQSLEVSLELQHINLTFLVITAGFNTQKEQAVQKLVGALIKINVVNHQNENEEENQNEPEEPMVEETFNGVFKVTIEPGEYTISVEKEGHKKSIMNYQAFPGEQEIKLPPLLKYIDDEQQQPDQKKKNRPSSSARPQKGILKQPETQTRIGTATTNKPLSDENSQLDGVRPSSSSITNVRINLSPDQINNNHESQQDSEERQPLSSQRPNDQSQNKPENVVSLSPTTEKRPSSGQQSNQIRPSSSNPNKNIQQPQKKQPSPPPEVDKFFDEWNFKHIQQVKGEDEGVLKPPKSSKEIKLTGISQYVIIQFKVITPNNQIIEHTSENISIQSEIKDKKIGLFIKQSSEYQSGVYRIFATILNKRAFNSQNLRVYASSNTSNSFLQIPTLTSQQNKGGQLEWDIGVFDVKTSKFFEINNIVGHQLLRDESLAPFEKLLNFMKSSRHQIQKILGFESPDQVAFEEDIYVKKKNIIDSLTNYEFNEASEIEPFLESASNAQGYCSFKKLQMKLIHKELENNPVRFINALDSSNLNQDDEDERLSFMEDS